MMSDSENEQNEKNPNYKKPEPQSSVRLKANRDIKLGRDGVVVGGDQISVIGGSTPSVIPTSAGAIEAEAGRDLSNDGKITGGSEINIETHPPSSDTSGSIKDQNYSSWANGSFYVFSFVIIVALLAYISRFSGAGALAIIAVVGLLSVPLIGAFQLRMQGQISEKGLLKLMKIIVTQLPLIRKLVK